MVELDEESDNESLSVLKDIDKKLNDIIESVDTYTHTYSSNMVKLELFNLVALVVAIGILTYNVFKSPLVVLALLAIVTIVYIIVILDLLKIKKKFYENI